MAENAVKRRIHLSSPHMSDQGYERAFVDEAFATNWVAPLGPNVDAFEKELADTIGVKGALAVSSGTAAVHLALKAAGFRLVILFFARILRSQPQPTLSATKTLPLSS